MSVNSDRSEETAASARDGGAWSWTLVAGCLAMVAALAGLLLDEVYTGAASTAAMLRGYDLVTATVAVPALAVAAWTSRRRETGARLVGLSIVAYLAYTYAYYLFGTGFNDLLLLHVAVFASSMIALVLHLTELDTVALGARLPGPRRVRGAASVLGILGAALGGMWVYVALDTAVNGGVPAGSRLVETSAVVHLGIALDLTVLVPLYAAAALLLWRRAAWGYALGAFSLVAGVLHQVSYMVAMPFQVAADVPDAVAFDPGEPVIVLLYLLGAALLLLPPRSPYRGDVGRPVEKKEVIS